MIMTINSTYKETIKQLDTNEHRLISVVVYKLKLLADEMLKNEDTNGLVDLHNTLVNLDNVAKKASDLYIYGSKS